MQVTATDLDGVVILEPDVYGDERGWFMESFNAATFRDSVGEELSFVQDNHSRSMAGTLRGLHYQVLPPQGKLIRCTVGSIYDVAVDIRSSSARFGDWTAVELSADGFQQLWVPAGFAHGFYVLQGPAEVQYKTTEFYNPAGDRAIRWDDPTINITWPFEDSPTLSDKDAAAPLLGDAELFA